MERIKRVAITIVLNGLEHLKHNNYAEFLAKNFDYWVVIEGAVNNAGSTSWCKKIPDEYHKNGNSIDGTIEYLESLCNIYDNIIFIKADGVWKGGKDEMVKTGMNEIKKRLNKCFLWSIDVDEQWNEKQLINSEKELLDKNAKYAFCQFNHFVGEDLIAVSDIFNGWGSSVVPRLWLWEGEEFKQHKPPVLYLKSEDENRNITLTEKFNHYSYYFEEDVKFKDKWYSGHEGVYQNWLRLKNVKIFPQPLTLLFPQWGNNGTKIIKYKKGD